MRKVLGALPVPAPEMRVAADQRGLEHRGGEVPAAAAPAGHGSRPPSCPASRHTALPPTRTLPTLARRPARGVQQRGLAGAVGRAAPGTLPGRSERLNSQHNQRSPMRMASPSASSSGARFTNPHPITNHRLHPNDQSPIVPPPSTRCLASRNRNTGTPDQRGEHPDRQLHRRDHRAGGGIGVSNAPPASVAAGSSRRWSLPRARRIRWAPPARRSPPSRPGSPTPQ